MAPCAPLDDSTIFLQLATAAYGWMPRILRLDPQHLNDAINACKQAREATENTWCAVPIDRITACLHSVVGASKVLHFANPEIFPIWDRNVETFRLSAVPSQYHMNQSQNYKTYAKRVHEIRGTCCFTGFYDDFSRAFKDRLHNLKIPCYCITEIRAIEAAAFELACKGNNGT